MANYFLDTSAIVKRYVQETGTAWIRALTSASAGNFLYVVRLTEVEVTSALARRRGQTHFSVSQARQALALFSHDLAQDYRIAELNVLLIKQAAQVADRRALRAYDAVQLVAALSVQSHVPDLIFVSADITLNSAASLEGLSIEDPNAHP